MKATQAVTPEVLAEARRQLIESGEIDPSLLAPFTPSQRAAAAAELIDLFEPAAQARQLAGRRA